MIRLYTTGRNNRLVLYLGPKKTYRFLYFIHNKKFWWISKFGRTIIPGEFKLAAWDGKDIEILREVFGDLEVNVYHSDWPDGSDNLENISSKEDRATLDHRFRFGVVTKYIVTFRGDKIMAGLEKLRALGYLTVWNASEENIILG